MGMPAQQTEWTADMARALPDDGKRYEVLDGELFVTPSPRLPHQLVVGSLFVALDAYVRAHSLGLALMSPADIEFSPRRLVQPDVFVAPFTAKGPPRDWRDISSLLVAIEVLSPSTARRSATQATDLSERTGSGVLDRRLGRASRRALASRGRAAGDHCRRPGMASATRCRGAVDSARDIVFRSAGLMAMSAGAEALDGTDRNECRERRRRSSDALRLLSF
jgi:hypothetical protein